MSPRSKSLHPVTIASHLRTPKATHYDRIRDLPRLALLWPEEIADCSLAGREKLVSRLQAMLRQERQRGLAGEWSYDLARHRQLAMAYRAEYAAWQQASRARQWAAMTAGNGTPMMRA